MNLETAKPTIAPFYDALNRPANKDVAGLVRGATSAEWRTFQIMTIDIHTVKDGKLVTAHHVEDWAAAIR